ncbi:hypothetical protein EON63_22065 [archaeon]|nr:MAG: hypothetical protein EON63_22065 [archaeon]
MYGYMYVYCTSTELFVCVCVYVGVCSMCLCVNVSVDEYMCGPIRARLEACINISLLFSQVPMELQGVMANIILPCSTQQEADALQTHLIDHHATYIVTNTVYSALQAKDIVYVRISAQVYLNLADFEKLAKLVKEYFKIM